MLPLQLRLRGAPTNLRIVVPKPSQISLASFTTLCTDIGLCILWKFRFHSPNQQDCISNMKGGGGTNYQ